MRKLIALTSCALLTFSNISNELVLAVNYYQPPVSYNFQRVINAANNIMANSSRADVELQNLGINTDNINTDFLKKIAASGNRQRLVDEVRWLDTNKERINYGTFNDPVYQGAKTSTGPINFVKNELLEPVISVKRAPQDVTRPAPSESSFLWSPWGLGLGIAAAAGIGLALSSGGGGGGNSAPAPTTPAPPSGDIDYGRNALPDIYNRTDFNTSEFTSFTGNALATSKFDYAYAKGAAGLSTTGTVEKVLMIHDWFPATFTDTSELPLSRIVGSTLNPSGDSSYEGVNPHGITVARKAAAEKNNASYHGAAYQARLYLYSTYNGFNISSGLNYAISNPQIGIINMSYGLNSGDTNTITLYQNVANANKLMVVATGNDATSQPNYPAYHAKNLNGYMLAAGAVNSSGILASYSNRCGDAMQWCVVAISGDGAQADQGTSFSTPLVSAAATIIWNSWPTLHANEVADIIRQTADDLGVAGVDAIYGWGRINMQNAMDPVGSSSFMAPSGNRFAFDDSSSITNNNSNPFGSGFSQAGIKILDSFNRDFTVIPNQHFVNKRDLTEELKLLNFNNSGAEVKQTLSDKMTVSFTDREEQSDISTSYKFSDNSDISLGFYSDITRFDSEKKFNSKNFLRKNEFENPFIALFEGENAINSIANYKYKNINFSLTNFLSQDQDNINYSENSDFAGSVISTGFESKNFSLDISNGFVNEKNSALGQKTSGSYNFAKDSRTIFTGVSSSLNFTDDWSLFGNYYYGRTTATADENSAFASDGDITSNSASIALTKENNFGKDRVSIAYSIPLSVSKGNLKGLYQDNSGQIASYTTDISQQNRNDRIQLSYENDLNDKINLIFTGFNESKSTQNNLDPLLGFIGRINIKF